MENIINNIDKNFWKNDTFLSTISCFENNIKLLSFDIFDTLLFRTVSKPQDIFLKVGEEAAKKKCLRFGLTAFDFMQMRVIAQQKARNIQKKLTGSIEVNLDMIYEVMPKNIGIKNCLKDIEIDVEKKCGYINPNVFSLIKYFKAKDIPIVLLSDMYLSSNQICDILKFNFFPIDWIGKILVSNEEGGGKSNGYLFNKLLNYYPKIKKTCILHIGDNKAADFEGASLCGIKSIHYNVVPLEKNTMFEMERVYYGEILDEIKSLRKLGKCLNTNYLDYRKTWFDIGTSLLGSFLSSFCDWIVDICVKERKKGVYTFMREGMILSKLILNAAKKRHINLVVKPIYVSRQATALASIDKLDEEEIGNLLDRKNLKVSNLFKMLQIEDKDTKVFSKYYDIFIKESSNITVSTGENLKDKIINFLLEDKIYKKTKTLFKEKRELLVKYLLQETNGCLQDIVTVDFGFKGTIQSAIERALKYEKVPFRITHIIAIGSEKTKYHIFNGMDIRGFVSNAGENFDIVENIIKVYEPIEQLMMGEVGSTIGYKTDGNNIIQPVLGKNAIPKNEIELKKICEEGIFSYQTLWLYLIERKPKIKELILYNKKRELGKLLSRLIQLPTYDEAKYLGDLHYDDNYGSDNVSVICCNNDYKLIEQRGVDEFYSLISYGYDYTKVRWPQAIITTYAPKYLVRKYLEQNNNYGYFTIMRKLVNRIKQSGIKEIVIYGAGEAGQELLKVAKLYELNVSYFVDRKKSLWGEFIEGIEITSLSRIKSENKYVYAIGSLTFIIDIKKTIKDFYEDSDKKPIIFCIEEN